MRHLLSFILSLTCFMVSAEDFTYTHEGQTLTYTILEGKPQTCKLKDGTGGKPGNSVSGKVVIPSSIQKGNILYKVTGIGRYAFCGCSGLTSVTLPNGVTSIGDGAFKDCSGLTSAAIPNSVALIGDDAFSGCSRLTSVNIPNGVKSIRLQTFFNCSSLTSVTIPKSVTSIGDGAFSGCSGLTSVAIPNSVTSIGKSAFNGCISLTSIAIPNSITLIEDDTFSHCSSMTSVDIPKSIKLIGNFAFGLCSSLTSVNIHDVEAWCNIDFKGGYANPLYYAHNLHLNGKKVTELVIPESVKSINAYAFDGCSGLTSTTFRNDAIYIGRSAFRNCSGLTSVTIPNGVTTIDKSAFDGCSGLTSVNIHDVASWCNIDFKDKSANPLYHAHNLHLNGERITELVIPDNVKTISKFAFSGYSGLTSVTIPKSVTSIAQDAFEGCNGLTSVNIHDVAAWCNIDFTDIYSNPLYYAHNLHLNGEKVTKLVIPDGVTSISKIAFEECYGLTSVEFPNSVKSIGEHAFFNCI